MSRELSDARSEDPVMNRVCPAIEAGPRSSFARDQGIHQRMPGVDRTSAWVSAIGERAVTDRRDADCLIVVCELIDDPIRAYAQRAQALQPAA